MSTRLFLFSSTGPSARLGSFFPLLHPPYLPPARPCPPLAFFAVYLLLFPRSVRPPTARPGRGIRLSERRSNYRGLSVPCPGFALLYRWLTFSALLNRKHRERSRIFVPRFVRGWGASARGGGKEERGGKKMNARVELLLFNNSAVLWGARVASRGRECITSGCCGTG